MESRALTIFNPIRKFFSHVTRSNCRQKVGNFKNRTNDQKSSNTFLSLAAFTGVGCGFYLAAPLVSTHVDVLSNVNGGLRFLRSLKVGLWISVDYYFSMVGLDDSSANYNAMMGRVHQRAADSILKACLDNGGSYIKLGQGLVAMSHVLPKEYIETLKVLQDKCLSRKPDELIKLFQEDFGKRPEDMYKEFDSEPFAAASLAQVFQAVTKEDKKVAVKVQYIDLQKRFHSDVATIKFLLNIAAFMHPDFNFTWIIDDLKDTMAQELDFQNEARNSEKCAVQLAHFNYIYVPVVEWDYCSKRVLVTEFIDGDKISEVKVLEEKGFSLADINYKMFEAFGYQIFQTGFVHADPHPGNVLVRKHKGQTQLVLLDHGLYQQVSEEDRNSLSHMWKAIVLTDHEEMRKYSNLLGVEDYEIFAEILAQAPLKSNNFKLKIKLTEHDLKMMTQFARDRFDMIMNCLKTMPCTLLLVLRNLNILRAISHDHGNPIDRYSVLARAATKSTFNSAGFMGRISKLRIQTYFELKLFTNRISTWFRRTIMKVLVTLGVAPDINKIMSSVR